MEKKITFYLKCMPDAKLFKNHTAGFVQRYRVKYKKLAITAFSDSSYRIFFKKQQVAPENIIELRFS